MPVGPLQVFCNKIKPLTCLYYYELGNRNVLI